MRSDKFKRNKALFFWLLRWSIILGLPCFFGYMLYSVGYTIEELLLDIEIFVGPVLRAARELLLDIIAASIIVLREIFRYLYIEYARRLDVMLLLRYTVYVLLAFYVIGYFYFFFKHMRFILRRGHDEDDKQVRLYMLLFGAMVLIGVIYAVWSIYIGGMPFFGYPNYEDYDDEDGPETPKSPDEPAQGEETAPAEDGPNDK